ncbi:MAG: LysR family transcriptional regulator [Roseobacter sp.]
MEHLDLKRIRYYLKLVETLNFSEAARALKITQSGLTKAIAHLEKDIGGPLLRREGKNTHLTQLGEALVAHFTAVDETARHAQNAAKRLVNGDMPVLRIGLMCTIGPQFITDFLSRFRQNAPELEIIIRDLNRSELSRTLLNGEVDLALVGADVEESQRFRYLELYREQMVIACAHDHRFSRRQSVSLEDVMHEPYVDRLQCEFRDTFISEGNRRAFVPMFAARSDREEWAQSLVAKGVGVALVPEYSTVVSNLSLVPLDDFSLQRTVSLAVPIGREDTMPVQRFLKAAREYEWSCEPTPS